MRLIAGGLDGAQHLAGIEITLDPGFKTYWRTPGDSGLPPNFDWSGSENVATVELRWPAPKRQEDAGGVAYVYGGNLVLPVLVTPRERDKPVNLRLAIDYGVCKDICIPARAELSEALPADGAHRDAIEGALAHVPRPQPLDARAALAIVGIEQAAQDKSAFRVTVRAPDGAKPTLFAEGPENWYLSTSFPDAGNTFTVTVEDRPKDATGPIPVRLTLVAGPHAIETEVRLDAGQQPR
ncbi:protein-disulfide reductase DsbD domain-containing protein [Microvirga subterranea]|uniref:protein-disulfide reductase DsbD domain-containing protein n=1 Tax=Microvirga subterranea TaxID=186651 RepID=UPI001473E652|nr:protein-disulfide reductase DsbD domain-containing protein [Microvirga subterranea]